MTTPFDKYLNAISNRITICDDDRQSYTADFDVIRDYVFNIMREYDSDFNMICKGASLFGSYANNVRICYPNEFDVHMLLSFPFSSYISVDADDERPGYVNLDISDVISELENVNGYDDLYDLLNDELIDGYNQVYLRRSYLQNWINNILTDALEYYGTKVKGATGIVYRLEYSKRGLAHTVYAHGRTQRGQTHNISIDFVPAIMLSRAEWMTIPSSNKFLNKCDRWYAVPKPTFGSKNTRKFAFMICCPKAEHDLLLRKQSLKVVYRLLKSLRDAYKMPRMKSYFFTTAFLWEIIKQPNDFWHRPLSKILIHMLDVLEIYFADGFLPFFWNKNLNLLDALHESEIESYADQLRKAYNTLITYNKQPKLTYARTLDHFKIPEGR